MPRLTLRAFGYALTLSFLFGSLPVLAATSQPVLYSIGASAPRVLAQGAQKSWPVKISEDSALAAVFQGGMWLPTPGGGRIYAKYERHIVHAGGIWTWVGTVDTVNGTQQVVLTFGEGGVFGLIPQASGYPLRIVTSQGETSVVETSAAAMARSTQTLRLRSQRDYAIPPRIAPKGGQNSLMIRAAADAAVKQAAASPGPVTIDVMVAYSTGFENMLGSRSLALTRIQNLVDITNQAYITSGVNQRIRLVYTTEVSYPDNTSNQSALDDITGIDENGNPVSVPAALANIASLRTQYGADLVVMMRRYDNSTQGDCGVGWLIGGGQTTIVPSESNVYGYSVVSDGKDGGYYCLDTTFAHELGHNMGDAHDRANATSPGAYSYSYGYVGNGTNGFSTIMAYGTDTQTPLAVFSNPNISTCQNTPCGVADSSSSSADNAHSMNNTAAQIAAFQPTVVHSNTGAWTIVGEGDVNGDGDADLILYNQDSGNLGWWIMNGSIVSSYHQQRGPIGYHVATVGDFNGDGKTDVLWTNSSHSVLMWLSSGNTFGQQSVGAYPQDWAIVGAGDINGDGKADLLLYNASNHRLGWWLMNGFSVISYHQQTVPLDYAFLCWAGDFNGDGKSDLIWSSRSRNLLMWVSTGNAFTSQYESSYPSNWNLVDTGDVNGDGYADLLFYNPTAGRLGWWTMNGPKVQGYFQQTAPTGYSLKNAGDFNGDGKADVTLVNGSNDVIIWLNRGTLFSP